MDTVTANNLYWPTEGHPGTGEPFVDGSLKVETEREAVGYGKPRRPEPLIETKAAVYDDDEGFCIEEAEYRDATPDEYAAMLVNYERALTEWNETGGMLFVEGRTFVSGLFTCKSGATARGVRENDTWHWRAWDVKS